jgi:6-pyruvoyltetrahydropterin/6-carboxytetrahydropterin synthase
MINGEREVSLDSIIIHETETGYAQGFYEDAHSSLMGEIKLEDIIFSPQTKSEWSNPNLWDDMLKNVKIDNPKVV